MMQRGKYMELYGTFGPSCCETELLSRMLDAGMTGIRLNLSHGNLLEHPEWLYNWREAQLRSGRHAELMIDLKGAELRIVELKGKSLLCGGELVNLYAGAVPDAGGPVRISPDLEAQPESQQKNQPEGKDSYLKELFLHGDKSLIENVGTAGSAETVFSSRAVCHIGIPQPLYRALRSGQHLFINDAELELEVLPPRRSNFYPSVGTEWTKGEKAVSERDHDLSSVSMPLSCRVLRGGMAAPGKSIALRGVEIPLPVLTPADIENLAHAREAGVTAVMQPFVECGEDVELLRRELSARGLSKLRIFAKIENQAGIEHLDEIMAAADHIVIARGDLGSNIGFLRLPKAQEEIARRCRAVKKPFMVVTQLLHSMTEHSVPTRAELSDIYLAVRQGASSLMLTGETAIGSYPLEAMRWLRDIAEASAIQD